ncbi:hypothetical protein DWF00_16585 [Bosea caraganae]|uniref:Uncharacterized protein n=1 Tax=Bosea caraganae TaxID=2763117 RepID=A0A370KYW9_9HYPH|nr:hypothetical protein [Bosea caraganae]RDJ20126.1 hypothetical protein DWE98_26190 [Bosea caraganae]RDJ24838.1 hypothetical protein DWF00_16585 [Bosea caraganae]
MASNIFDQFDSAAGSSGPLVVTVAPNRRLGGNVFDQFDAPEAPAIGSPTGFATRAQREGGDTQMRQAEYLAGAVRIREQQDKPSPLGRVDAFMRGAASWVPGMNKLAAAGDAAFGAGQGESFGDRYSDNLERQRALDAADEALNPGSRIAGQVGGFLPTALVSPGVRVVREGARGATVLNAAATGGLYGALTGAVESDGDAADKALAAGQMGVAGGVLGGALGATVGAVSKRLGRAPAAVPEGVLAADEVGIRLTQGQRSADPAVLSRENAMAGGAYGDRAQRVAQEAIAEQRAQALAARDRIGATAARGQVDLGRPGEAGGIVGEAIDDFASRARSAYEAKQGRITGTVREASDVMASRFNPQDVTPVDAGGRIAAATRQAAEVGKRGYQQAYGDAFAREGQVAPEFFTGVARSGDNGLTVPGSPNNEFAAPLSRRITETLLQRAEPIIPDATLTPAASRTLAEVDRIASLNLGRIGNPAPGQTVEGVSLRGVEQARKIIIARYKDAKANPADARAMRGIIEAFDDQLERAFSSSLFSGDETALAAIKAARGEFSAWQRTFRPNGPGDDAGRAVQRIIERGGTDEEVANYLIGASRVGDSGLSARLFDRLGQVLGKDSAEFGAIRGAAWQKLTGGFDATDAAGARKIAERIAEFTGERGRTLASKMFNSGELEAMQRYSKSLQMFSAWAKAQPDNPQAQASVKLLMDVADRRMSPEDLSSAIFGFGNKSSSTNLRLVDAIGDLIGKDGPEWAAIRQGVWQRIANVAEGQTEMGAQKMSQRILNFVGGEGQSLASRLFTSEEMGQMRKLATALKQTLPPPGATNPSNSGNRGAGQMREMARRTVEALLTTIGASMGGWTGAAVGLAGGKGVGAVAGINAARQARSLYYPGNPTPIAPRLAERLGASNRITPQAIGLSGPVQITGGPGSTAGYLPAAAEQDER